MGGLFFSKMVVMPGRVILLPSVAAFQLFGGSSPLTVDHASLSSQTARPYNLSPRRPLPSRRADQLLWSKTTLMCPSLPAARAAAIASL
jgi:hypothetical protein